MLPDLQSRLAAYVESFNRTDEECYVQAIPNDAAYAFLSPRIPLLDCPDAELEKTYYFRWWTYRKHFKRTPFGHIVTEFLPPVPWAGPYNSINCAACHHIREGRWLADPDGWLGEYIDFWLDGHGDAMAYSMWPATAVEEYALLHGGDTFTRGRLDRLVALYRRREEAALRPCGLFWSDDDRDGMEFSISGPGLRPTLNSYLYGDAAAIARMARCAGRAELAGEFAQKARRIRAQMDRLLWDGRFYKTIPCARGDAADFDRRPVVAPEHDVRELIGYLPWAFGAADGQKAAAFAALTDEAGFAAPRGLTTAERRHPRFRFEHEHECLWNGPSWPFATSQTLVAAAALLRGGCRNALTPADYYRMLRQYALAHRRTDGRGRELPWIDEDMDPFTGEWIARRILKSRGWRSGEGGYERGKDYNHSLFCDLVLSGLLGIAPDGRGGLTADPLIPDDWGYFCVIGVPFAGRRWNVVFDRNGERYGLGAGLRVLAGD